MSSCIIQIMNTQVITFILYFCVHYICFLSVLLTLRLIFQINKYSLCRSNTNLNQREKDGLDRCEFIFNFTVLNTSMNAMFWQGHFYASN